MKYTLFKGDPMDPGAYDMIVQEVTLSVTQYPPGYVRAEQGFGFQDSRPGRPADPAGWRIMVTTADGRQNVWARVAFRYEIEKEAG